jgi:hypothetical protein
VLVDDGGITLSLTGVRSERPRDRNANWRHFDDSDEDDCVVVVWLIGVDVLVMWLYIPGRVMTSIRRHWVVIPPEAGYKLGVYCLIY